MKDGTTIAMNLHRIAVEQDFQETLLDEEKCAHCGRELTSPYSRKTHCCGACSRKGLNGRPTTNESAERKRARAEKHGWDYDFNKGHGDKFIAAFDRAFNLKPIIIKQGGQSTKSPWQSVPARLHSSQAIKGKADELTAGHLSPLGSIANTERCAVELTETKALKSGELKSSISEREIANKPHCSRSIGLDETVEVKHGTTKQISTKDGQYILNMQPRIAQNNEPKTSGAESPQQQPYSVARSITAGFELADRGSNPLGAFPARLFLSENPIPLQDIGGQISMAKIPPPSPVSAEQKHAGVFSPIEGFSSCVLPPIQQILACDLLRAPDLHFTISLQLRCRYGKINPTSCEI